MGETRKLFPFSRQALKGNNKEDVSEDSLKGTKGVGGKGHKTEEEWSAPPLLVWV